MSEPSEHMEHASPACPHCAAVAEAAAPEPAEMAAECRAAPEPPEAEAEAALHACCCRHKVRTPEEHKALLNRLSRIEGQIRGIRGMVEKDVYCADILVQVAAANSALNSFTRELLGQHIRTCVADDLRAGQDEKLDELLKLLPKLMK